MEKLACCACWWCAFAGRGGEKEEEGNRGLVWVLAVVKGGGVGVGLVAPEPPRLWLGVLRAVAPLRMVGVVEMLRCGSSSPESATLWPTPLANCGIVGGDIDVVVAAAAAVAGAPGETSKPTTCLKEGVRGAGGRAGVLGEEG